MKLKSSVHVMPSNVEKEIKTALSYFPELNEIPIKFIFKKNIKKSTMLAQPSFLSFLKPKKQRSYVILMSEKFKISDQEFLTENIPSEIFIGWVGHELGHIMDYQSRSKLNLIGFGIKYLLSENHVIEAERAADSFAVSHGMGDYILKTKNFILNHADIDLDYKNKIKKYYLSPEEIMELVASIGR